MNAIALSQLESLLASANMPHLSAAQRGRQLVIYSMEQGEKENRVRFTDTGQGRYQLSFADHRGRWEPTPFEGTLNELFDQVLSQFAWTLAPY